MKTLFTLHAGEVVVGEHIEREFKNAVEVWVPTKDTGVDLLVTNKNKKSLKALKLQVKISRDFTHGVKNPELWEHLHAFGWYSLARKKIEESTADYWIFVLLGFKDNSRDFVIIQPTELLRRLDAIHLPKKPDIFQTHIWITDKRCWETRGLGKKEQSSIAKDIFNDKNRDFKEYLNNWDAIKEHKGL